MFPRITMLVVGTVSSFGLLGWLGFIFAPHLTVAILATTFYWHTNPESRPLRHRLAGRLRRNKQRKQSGLEGRIQVICP